MNRTGTQRIRKLFRGARGHGRRSHVRWEFASPWSPNRRDKRLTSKRARQADRKLTEDR